ncbi:MAG: hypothetical protein K0R18_763 [Bacillales bacterium]|jgi:hypothetical protein|nr:hypothetical protein [Bacillales bacterium]
MNLPPKNRSLFNENNRWGVKNDDLAYHAPRSTVEETKDQTYIFQ